MIKMSLFDESDQDRIDFKRIGPIDYQFLDRTNQTGASIIRSRLNSWFSLLCDEMKPKFLARIKAEKNFAGAFFELFLLGLFNNLGFNVEPEPTLQNNPKIPDFCLRRGRNQIFVEATTNNYDISETCPHFNIRKQIIEELNQLDLKHIKLQINRLDVFVDVKPSIKPLKRQLQDYCHNLDLQMFNTYGFPINQDYVFSYKDEGNRFIFSTSFYLDMRVKNQQGGTVFIDSYDIGVDETNAKLLRSIEAKKSKYGELKKPYIICVNFTRTMPSPNNFLSMLFSPDTGENPISGQHSIFSFDKNPENKSLSGLIVSFVGPFNMYNPPFYLFKNPDADLSIDGDLFPFDTFEIKEGNICFTPAQIKFSELLDIH
jgi:hypothetical protein